MAERDIVQNLISQLGQSQDERLPAELGAHFVDVDERGPEELLRLWQRLAPLVRHYDTAGVADGDWTPFFVPTRRERRGRRDAAAPRAAQRLRRAPGGAARGDQPAHRPPPGLLLSPGAALRAAPAGARPGARADRAEEGRRAGRRRPAARLLGRQGRGGRRADLRAGRGDGDQRIADRKPAFDLPRPRRPRHGPLRADRRFRGRSGRAAAGRGAAVAGFRASGPAGGRGRARGRRAGAAHEGGSAQGRADPPTRRPDPGPAYTGGARRVVPGLPHRRERVARPL